MRAEQVLHMQADLVQRFRDVRFKTYVAGGIMDQTVRGERADRLAAGLTEGLAQQVRLADVYRVTEDMCDLLRYAADGLDDTDRIDRTLRPTPWGLVRFEKALPMKDIRGKTMLIHWATWGPAAVSEHEAVFVTFWNDPGTEPDEIWLDMEERLAGNPERLAGTRSMIGRWATVGAEMLTDGQRLGPKVVRISEEERAAREQAATEFGQAYPEAADFVGDDPILDDGSFTNVHRYMHALWLLLGQTITDVREEHVKSSTRKRLGRMRIPGKVSVVTLRKRKGAPSKGESNVIWQHKFVVRGHWAWRVCGPDHPLAQAAPVKGGIGCRLWINPYWKNADTDLPVVQSTKVYQLSR